MKKTWCIPMYIQELQRLSAVRLHGCHQPVLTSKCHVSTDSGLVILFYWVFYLYLCIVQSTEMAL